MADIAGYPASLCANSITTVRYGVCKCKILNTLYVSVTRETRLDPGMTSNDQRDPGMLSRLCKALEIMCGSHGWMCRLHPNIVFIMTNNSMQDEIVAIDWQHEFSKLPRNTGRHAWVLKQQEKCVRRLCVQGILLIQDQ